MNAKYLLLLFLVSLALIVACEKSEQKVVARIGDDVLTVGYIKEQYLAISPGSRPDLRTVEEKEQFVKDVVSKEILKREAIKRGLDRSPEAIQAFQNALRMEAWQAYYNDKVRSRIKITEDDLKDLYAKQRYRYHLGWIFLRSKAMADEVAAKIKQGEAFEDLARVYSLDPSRDRNGDLGMRPLGLMPADVEEKIMAMGPGEVIGPLPYDTYYILVKLYSKEPVEQQDFEVVKTQLESLERMRRENSLHRQLAAKVREKYHLTFNDDVVDFVVSKFKTFYQKPGVQPGEIPEFSDEELSRKLATYDGGEWQVRTYVDRLKAQPGLVISGQALDAETLKSLVGDLITGELWSLEIRNEGYENRPEVRKAAERAQEEVIVTSLHDEIVKDVTVDDAKIAEFYEQNKEQLVTESGARLAVIIVATEEEAQQIYNELKKGGDFAELARAKSADKVSAERGDELLNPLYKRQLEQFPELEEVINSLDEDAYSKPMAVPPGFGPEGYMIVKVLEKIPARQMSLDEVKTMLHDRVLQLEQDRAFGEWLKERMTEYNVEIYPDVAGSVDFASLKERGA